MTEDNKTHEVPDPADGYELELDPSEVAESVDSDVDAALERETSDGKGGAVVPKSDFVSFATDNVETEGPDDATEGNDA